MLTATYSLCSTVRWNAELLCWKRKIDCRCEEIPQAGGWRPRVCYRALMPHLSLTGKRWILPETLAGGDVIDALIRRRGVDTLGEGEILESFGHDARTFRDFTIAAGRIARAVERQETVGIIGDYDCDGITGTALLTRFLRRRGMQPRIRLPHRVREGYGVKPQMIEEMREQKVTLLLTVDTGITAAQEIAAAREHGMDVLVLDHHHLPKTLPDALGILHPSLATPAMTPPPCGAGVAWSLIDALERESGTGEWTDRDTDIALAAIGTIADVMELKGANRTLVHQGLLSLQRISEGPLALLAMQAGLTPPFRARDVAFRIAPRINAAGRMADPSIALHAVLGDGQALLQLEELNRARQDVVQELLEQLYPRAESAGSPFLCFADERFSPGVCGLLAGKLTERFGKPSMIACVDGSACAASLRSIPGYDVTRSLEQCMHLLSTFGGHAMAGGCSFDRTHWSAITEILQEDARRQIDPALLVPRLSADAVLAASALTMELCERLRALEPFGEGNPEPRFLLHSVLLRDLRLVGGDRTHLQGSASGHKVIGFGLGHLLPHLAQDVDVLCRIGIQTWQGSRRLQLFIDDMRTSTPAPTSPPSRTPLPHSRQAPSRS